MTEATLRVARMDEAIAVVDALLRGERVEHDGPDFVVDGVAVGPRPIQQPRPPIWLGGMRPGALRRAARWDGWIAIAVSDDGGSMTLEPAALGRMVTQIRDERAALGRSADPFDVAVFGFVEPGDRDTPEAYRAAGATWWLESLSGMRGSLDQLLAIVTAGPPEARR